jgi:hypothetical protein
LETQLVVQDEEEHRKEKNKNYKQEFQEWLANIDGNDKCVLLLMSNQHTQQVVLNVTSYTLTMGKHNLFQWKPGVVLCN